MGYVAIRGGEGAIAAAVQALEAMRCGAVEPACEPGEPLAIAAVRSQLRLLVDRVIGEGGIYDPVRAAWAIKQAHGDPLEASFILRAWRSQLPRLGETAVHDTRRLRILRRISAAFKDVPGGQVLGPSTDYLQRLFRVELLDESPESFRAAVARLPGAAAEAADFPAVVDALRAEGLLAPVGESEAAVDITREPLVFPIPRPARLAHMARGETGALLAFAYSTMRGYGYLHPTVAELRVGWLPVELPHPLSGELQEAGEALITECQIVATHGTESEPGPPRILLGYGACFGHNETKAIAMAMCDRALMAGEERGARHPAEDSEFVICHIDGIEAMGFCNHYKLPHYVTFASDLENIRASRAKYAEDGDGGG
ncbi:MAG: carbon-phosphorus lyase complex subunit PhnI [Planctomycetota bacterium]|nr:carbon-phosphorus lyase complex subunit PhnI [Planctomycetota bacterium]MCX8039513.1 carbon-phosphorus lyase complex subunit PhnI [Planctomycetota bacterium]MDW8373033.1 carbon-phosphorus lyase complex subunit PhnI [Planctomycetota bacterium]